MKKILLACFSLFFFTLTTTACWTDITFPSSCFTPGNPVLLLGHLHEPSDWDGNVQYKWEYREGGGTVWHNANHNAISYSVTAIPGASRAYRFSAKEQTPTMPAYQFGWVVSQEITIYKCTTTPITLLFFSATKTNSGVLLNWETANEVDVDHFEVERSSDGGRTFVGIKNTSPLGDSKLYAASDMALPVGVETIFYRLKSVDINGQFSYSNIVKISIRGLIDIKVGPNPAITTITVYANAISQYNTTIVLYDMTGRSVIAKKFGDGVLDVHQVAPGMYIYKIINSDGYVLYMQKIQKE
jgi:hypothetical protein